LGNGDGTFQPLRRYPLPPAGDPAGLVTADFNGDGVPDLAAANFTQAAVAIFLGGTVTTGQLLNVPVIGANQAVQSTYTPNLDFYTGSVSNVVIVNGSGGIATRGGHVLPEPVAVQSAGYIHGDSNRERWR
jgi:hypothetical protein